MNEWIMKCRQWELGKTIRQNKKTEKNQPGGYAPPSSQPQNICKTELIWEGVDRETPVFEFCAVKFGAVVIKGQKL